MGACSRLEGVVAIAEGHKAVAQMLPAMRMALRA
jgi:hypothetical protein